MQAQEDTGRKITIILQLMYLQRARGQRKLYLLHVHVPQKHLCGSHHYRINVPRSAHHNYICCACVRCVCAQLLATGCVFSSLCSVELTVQLCVEEVYVLALLEDDIDRKNDLFKRFTEIAVDNAYHFQPG